MQAINERDRLKVAGFHNEAKILRNEVVRLHFISFLIIYPG